METTQEFRDAFRRQIDSGGRAVLYGDEILALLNDADRLARLEDGVIVREDWMPEWATKWCLGTRTCYWSDGEGNHEPAPNMRPYMLRPERVSDSPLTLPIISLDEDGE